MPRAMVWDTGAPRPGRASSRATVMPRMRPLVRKFAGGSLRGHQCRRGTAGPAGADALQSRRPSFGGAACDSCFLPGRWTRGAVSPRICLTMSLRCSGSCSRPRRGWRGAPWGPRWPRPCRCSGSTRPSFGVAARTLCFLPWLLDGEVISPQSCLTMSLGCSRSLSLVASFGVLLLGAALHPQRAAERTRPGTDRQPDTG